MVLLVSGSVKVAKLSMIDLAGSEKGSVTSSRAKARFREGANINKSLLALGNEVMKYSGALAFWLVKKCRLGSGISKKI